MPKADTGTALAAILHDPRGRLLSLLARNAELLHLYDHIFVVATTMTQQRLVDELRRAGARVRTDGDRRTGENRRRVLRDAVASGSNTIFACDFDRWLHWATTFPEELKNLRALVDLQNPDAWFVSLGRTSRAYATHPLAQRLTEQATNHVLSVAVGQLVDATAGACWLTREAADIVLDGSKVPTASTDTEWPALVYRADPPRLGFLACEGLEFETADQYGPEIAEAGGLAQWIDYAYDTPESWRVRLQLATDSVAAIGRVMGDT